MDITTINKQRDLYLTDEDNVYFLPKMWPIQEISEYDLDEDEAAGFEIWCYAPMFTRKNSPVDILWCRISELSKMREVSEKKAKEIHSILFQQLDDINNNKDMFASVPEAFV